ncbi:hypothetical protein [Pedobacter psychroterrae]|uniref:hypothetical protein n=1 Tax=Pedobacter psychroterrae TaxID=2530453 RepID=UPI0013F15E85|nr:hypothetical protein [Pedobacter psychroterrae]
MPAVIKKNETVKGFGPPVVINKLRSKASELFALEKAEEAGEKLKKTTGLPSFKTK